MASLPRSHSIVSRWCPSAGATGYRLLDRVRSNHGVLTNMDPASDWVVSGGKGALDFDGSNDYIQGGILPAGIVNFAASAWIRANSGSGNSLMILSNVNAAVTTGAHFMVLNNGNLYAFAGSEFTSSTGDLRDNTWHQVAVSRIGNQGSFFLDGKLVQSGTIGSNVISNAIAIRIATRGDSTSQFFSGQIDDIRLYSRPLASGDVRQLWQLGRGNMPIARKRRYTEEAAAGFKAYWARRQSQLIGGGV